MMNTHLNYIYKIVSITTIALYVNVSIGSQYMKNGERILLVIRLSI